METSDSSDSCQGFLDNAPLTGPAGDPNYGSKLADLKESGCICVYWYHAVVLVLGYLSYALTCAYYQKLMASFCPGTGQSPAAVEDDWKKVIFQGFIRVAMAVYFALNAVELAPRISRYARRNCLCLLTSSIKSLLFV